MSRGASVEELRSVQDVHHENRETATLEGAETATGTRTGRQPRSSERRPPPAEGAAENSAVPEGRTAKEECMGQARRPKERPGNEHAQGERSRHRSAPKHQNGDRETATLQGERAEAERRRCSVMPSASWSGTESQRQRLRRGAKAEAWRWTSPRVGGKVQERTVLIQ